MSESKKSNVVGILTGLVIVALIGAGVMGFLKMESDNAHSQGLVTIEGLQVQVSDLENELTELNKLLLQKEEELAAMTATSEANLMLAEDTQKTLDAMIVDNNELEEQVTALSDELIQWAMKIDEDLLQGDWKAVAFVENVVDYNGTEASSLFPESELSLTGLKITSSNVTPQLKEGMGVSFKRVDDVILDDQIASGLMVKEINGKSYLFYEWKSGDYFSGKKPYYYVLEKN